MPKLVWITIFSIFFSQFLCQNLVISQNITDLGAAADDFGHYIHNLPHSVIFPESDEQVKEAVLLAKSLNKRLSIRGTGHSTNGLAQCGGCIVINMSRMNKLRGYTTEWVEFDGGATLRVALETLNPLGYTTPVQTDHQDICVGGYLSTSTGLGPASFLDSSVSDNVLQLTVVTGNGEIVNASMTENADLFNSVRSGMGIFGVITSVKLRVVPIIGSRARVYTCYQTFDQMKDSIVNKLEAAKSLLHQWETFPLLNFNGTGVSFDPRYFSTSVPGAGLWVFLQQYAVFYNPGNEPNDAQLSNIFQCVEGTQLSSDMTYEQWIYRLDGAFAFLRQTGAWIQPHVWLDVLLPLETAFDFMNKTLAATTPDDVAIYSVQSMILIKYPTHRATYQLLPPSSESHYLYFGLLRQVGFDLNKEIFPEVARLVDLNNRIRLDSYSYSAKPSVYSTIPQSVEEWRQVFGESVYTSLVTAKNRYDPNHLFIDHGIFGNNNTTGTTTSRQE